MNLEKVGLRGNIVRTRLNDQTVYDIVVGFDNENGIIYLASEILSDIQWFDIEFEASLWDVDVFDSDGSLIE